MTTPHLSSLLIDLRQGSENPFDIIGIEKVTVRNEGPWAFVDPSQGPRDINRIWQDLLLELFNGGRQIDTYGPDSKDNVNGTSNVK